MKVNRKALAAAVMLALGAMSTVAFAEPTVPTPPNSPVTPTGDNGGLIFTLYSLNPDTPFSMSYYLGLTINQVVPTEMDQPGLNLTWSVQGLSNIPGSVPSSNLHWAVYAADAGSTSVVGSARLATTVFAANSTPATTTNGLVVSAGNIITNYNANANLFGDAVDFTTNPTDILYLPSILGDALGSNNLQVGANVGDALDFYIFTNAGNRFPATTASNVKYDGQWTFNLASGSLTYAVGGSDPSPVPVPAAVWLLLSGLGGLGFVGRRKDQQG